MKIAFSELEEGSLLTLHISNASNNMELSASIYRHVKPNIALIELNETEKRALNFNNVQVNVIYTDKDGIPYIWMNCSIVYHQKKYIVKVPDSGGHRYNRRGSFRVGVSRLALLHTENNGFKEVLVRDVSFSGFSITDRNKTLRLSEGSIAAVSFEDLGQQIDLIGKVVRIENTDDYDIYGCVITKSSRDLATYINLKQRKKKQNKK